MSANIGTIEHAATCGVARLQWTDCNCGHFQGFDKPVHGSGHKEDCPCHCTCDFGRRLEEILKEPTPRKYAVTISNWPASVACPNGCVTLSIKAFDAADAIAQVKIRPDFIRHECKILSIEPESQP
jgi:hypothetical protein